MSTRNLALWTALSIGSVCASAGCGGDGVGPRFDDVDDQVVAVGSELSVPLAATSDFGDISFSYSGSRKFDGRARVTGRPDGSALFLWSPNASDLGEWTVTFSATDAQGTRELSIEVDVRSTVGQATMPRFRRPEGQGTSHDLGVEECVEFEVVVEDQDSSSVELTMEQPIVEGSNLVTTRTNEAFWRWCPTEEQVKAQERYIVTIGADDGENPKAIKRYLVVVRNQAKQSCPGDAPDIRHTPVDVTDTAPIRVEAGVSDDVVLKGAPLLYYTTDPLSDPPDLGSMKQLSMVLVDGDDRAGNFAVEIPNPLAGRDAAAALSLSYVIVASDNDDRVGDCDHISTESYTVNLSDNGGMVGAGYCESCTSDDQCGGSADLCMPVGVDGDTFCFVGCSADADCPDGAVCSAIEVESVDGTLARQCIPTSESCAPEAACEDDRFEDNDGKDQALELAEGLTLDLKMCPLKTLGADDDWYAIELAEDSDLTVTIAGGTYPNLELRLIDEAGHLVAASEDWGSDDSVARCLAAGTYYIRVFSYFAGENDYQITYTRAPATCEVNSCTDDAFEDDDNGAQARLPDFEAFGYSATGNFICSADQDWYKVYLFDGESIYGTLSFVQNGPEEDLDFLVYDESETLLTRCTVDDFEDCSNNGQSSDSNEDFVFTSTSAQFYYIVVNGFDGASNSYDICLGLNDPTICQ